MTFSLKELFYFCIVNNFVFLFITTLQKLFSILEQTFLQKQKPGADVPLQSIEPVRQHLSITQKDCF